NPDTSSRLAQLHNLPNLRRRSESGSRLPAVSRSSVMDLNFTTLKGFPYRPGLVCENKTGVPSLYAINIASVRITGRKISNVQKLTIKSKRRFITDQPSNPIIFN